LRLGALVLAAIWGALDSEAWAAIAVISADQIALESGLDQRVEHLELTAADLPGG
jgi:hypothetical protein